MIAVIIACVYVCVCVCVCVCVRVCVSVRGRGVSKKVKKIKSSTKQKISGFVCESKYCGVRGGAERGRLQNEFPFCSLSVSCCVCACVRVFFKNFLKDQIIKIWQHSTESWLKTQLAGRTNDGFRRKLHKASLLSFVFFFLPHTPHPHFFPSP